MTWRVGKISGSLGSTWRVTRLSGSVTAAPSTTWRLAKVSGLIATGWRVTAVSGVVTQSVTPVLASPGAIAADPVQPVTLVAQVTNGIVPDSYSFTSTGITFTTSGNTATFLTPGSATGGTVTVTITATKSGNTSSPVTATVVIAPCPVSYLALDGTMHAASNPYQS